MHAQRVPVRLGAVPGHDLRLCSDSAVHDARGRTRPPRAPLCLVLCGGARSAADHESIQLWPRLGPCWSRNSAGCRSTHGSACMRGQRPSHEQARPLSNVPAFSRLTAWIPRQNHERDWTGSGDAFTPEPPAVPATATSGPNCNGTQVCDSRGECGACPPEPFTPQPDMSYLQDGSDSTCSPGPEAGRTGLQSSRAPTPTSACRVVWQQRASPPAGS